MLPGKQQQGILGRGDQQRRVRPEDGGTQMPLTWMMMIMMILIMIIIMAMMTMTIIMIMLIYDISATQRAARRWWNTDAIDLDNDDYDDLDHDYHYGNDDYDHHHDYADL